MAVSLISTVFGTIPESLLSMWMEVAMAVVAAILYFCLTSLARYHKVLPRKGVKHSSVGPPGKYGVRTVPEDEVYFPEHHHARRALQAGDLDEAVAALLRTGEATPRGLPRQLGVRLLSTAATAACLETVTNQLKPLAGKFQVDALEGAMVQALRRGDMVSCRKLHAFASALNIPLSQKTVRALAKAYADDTTKLSDLVATAPLPLARPVAEAMLEACTRQKEVELAAEIFEKTSKTDTASLRIFVERLAAGSKLGAQKDLIAHAKLIRAHAKNKDLTAAIDAFEKFHTEQVMGAPLYNSILDACVECQDLERALAYFQQAKSEGHADTVSFNILMKGHIGRGDIQAAELVLKHLKSSGLTLTPASYNALLGYRVQSGDNKGAWRIVEEMREAGIPVGVVTCSILLRSQCITGPEVSRVLSMVDEGRDPMDEALFVSLIDACVRTGNLKLLTQKREEHKARGGRMAFSAPIYGSMIKAYGQARILEQVWALWQEMIANEVKATPITFGCMVEALVANGAAKHARELVNQMWHDESQRPLVNTVIYSTILKGFATAREPKEVMALYEEMRARGIQPNTITYNTILNAFAHCAAMHRVPALLEDMRNAEPPVEPDLVTYSTLVKGFCSNGDVDRGLKILEQMTTDGEFAPDEVMYNSLLDGCAKEQRLDDALRLLDDMKQRGVAPSNYTLSMLVKLMGRCRRLGQAFSLIQNLSQEHCFKINLQVYTCLIQACFKNKQLTKALALHDQLLAEGVRPDEKLYTSLVQGCLQAGAVDQAVLMLRCAYNLPGCSLSRPPRESFPGVEVRCLNELIAKLGGEGAPEAATLLREVRACTPQAPVPHAGKGKGAGRFASRHAPTATW